MARNAALLEAIQKINQNIKSGKIEQKDAVAALDEFLSAEHTAEGYSAAITKEPQAEFWNAAGFPKEIDEADDLLDESNLKDLRQAAAEQRVSIGLNRVADPSVIIGILEHNGDECRNYLAQVAQTAFLKSPDWSGFDAVIKSEILSEEYIENVRKQLAIQRLESLITSTSNVEGLKGLAECTGDKSIQQAAKKLGFPSEKVAQDLLTVDLMDGNAPTLKNLAAERYFNLAVEAYKQDFKGV